MARNTGSKKDRKPHPRPIRNAFIEDISILWSRGVHTKQDMAKALGITVQCLDQRIARARKDGELPKATRGTQVFDPFGKMQHMSGFYTGGISQGRTRSKYRLEANSDNR